MKTSFTLLLVLPLLLTLLGCKNIVTLDRPQSMSESKPKVKPTVPKKSNPSEAEFANRKKLVQFCQKELKSLPGKSSKERIKSVCADIAQLEGCSSVKGDPIFHYDRLAKENKKDKKGGKRILTLGLVHGDEVPSGSVARSWMERLDSLDPRNSWRVLPIVNPDGLRVKTRTNANKVDINRNFPTQDWDAKALEYWRRVKGSDPRRFPGHSAASEIETQCMVKHIAEFKPDFIIAIHTPLGLLDFDGPKKIKFPQFKPLPWVSLGNFPGSLGRYAWKDRNIPVLTIELKGQQGVNRLEMFDRLQDISGTVAIQATRVKKKPKRHHAQN